MLALERRLQDRYPHWFAGRRSRLVRPLLRGLQKWSGLDALDAFLEANRDLRGFALVQAGLDFLQARYVVAPTPADCIPARGRLLIVANHPSGALDALALLDCVGQVRRDVKIVANDFLWALEGLRELLLPVRILGGAPSPASVRAIEQALAQEQCVIVFPAGEVSRLGWGGVADGRWRRGFLRFALRTAAPVLPVRIHARNSALFYGASALFKPAGTALLAREMFARRERRIALSLGRARALPQDLPETELMRRLRSELYALGRNGGQAAPSEEALVAAEEPAQLAVEVAALRSLGHTLDGKQIRVGRLRAGSALLREIGRLRELTFRAVGEGTGRRLDLDDYDTWYEHIVLWDSAAACVVGAYRVARGAPVLAERGLAGFYTAGLFRYGEALLPRIAAGMELGRSFVVPDYWGSRSIDYLWQGIGAYLRDYPQVRYLYGAVSISAALPRQAREQIVAYYAHYYGDARGEAASTRPFDYAQAPPAFDALDADTAFKVLKGNLDALGAAVPMLYKQYTELCEPGGARFLAFGVDPAFNDAVDGLIELDLQRIRSKKRVRYLERPRSEAEVMA